MDEDVYIYNELLLGHNNEIVRYATTWTDLEYIILSEINQRHRLCDFTYGLNLKTKHMDKYNQTETTTNTENKQVAAGSEVGGSRGCGCTVQGVQAVIT